MADSRSKGSNPTLSFKDKKVYLQFFFLFSLLQNVELCLNLVQLRVESLALALLVSQLRGEALLDLRQRDRLLLIRFDRLLALSQEGFETFDFIWKMNDVTFLEEIVAALEDIKAWLGVEIIYVFIGRLIKVVKSKKIQ